MLINFHIFEVLHRCCELTRVRCSFFVSPLKMFCLSEAPSNVWILVFRLLIGNFERFRLIENSWLLFEVRYYVGILIPVHKRVLESLSLCSFMDVYHTIRKAHHWISCRIYLGQPRFREGSFGFRQNWDALTRQCALRACGHQTGIWTPVAVCRGIRYEFHGPTNYLGSIMSSHDKYGGSPQQLIEEFINGHRNFLVVCSTRCYCTVESLLRLCYLMSDIMVLRGTHLASPRLLSRFRHVVRVYEVQRHTTFQAGWGQFNTLIDTLDVSMEQHEAEYCALYMTWRQAKARGFSEAENVKLYLDHAFQDLVQLDQRKEDLDLLQPRLLLHSGSEEEHVTEYGLPDSSNDGLCDYIEGELSDVD